MKVSICNRMLQGRRFRRRTADYHVKRNLRPCLHIFATRALTPKNCDNFIIAESTPLDAQIFTDALLLQIKCQSKILLRNVARFIKLQQLL